MVRIITFSGMKASAISIRTAISTARWIARARRSRLELEVDEGRATEDSEVDDRIQAEEIERRLESQRPAPHDVEVAGPELQELEDHERRRIERDGAEPREAR